MRFRTPRERLRSRRFTCGTILLWTWIVIVLLWILGLRSCFTRIPDPDHPDQVIYHWDSDSPEGALYFLAIVVGLFLWATRHPVARRSLQARGWTFDGRGTHHFDGRFELHPFDPDRHHPKVKQAAWGEWNGRQAASFTLWRGRRYFYDIDLIELPQVLPGLALVPERLAGGWTRLLEGEDVSFESAAFNERWRVFSDDASYTHAVLHPLMMERLAEPDADEISISIDGGAIWCWVPGRSPIRHLDAHLGLLADLADLIPRHVYDDYGSPRPYGA